MRTLDRLCGLLPDRTGEAIMAMGDALCEVRLRAGRPAQLCAADGERIAGEAISGDMLNRILAALMDYSIYARERELGQGFFTMDDGCRVGVCGRLVTDDERIVGMQSIGSICVRVSREVRGCADALHDIVVPPQAGRPRTALLLSAPGMGKTTCLRELGRRLSEDGFCVGLADERRELAASRDGAPTLDVGPRTDVMDGAPKHIAIRHMLRAMAPQVILADEIGGERDAEALADAARCGVKVIATAHASGIDAAMRRPALREILAGGAFELAVLLGGGERPGQIAEIREL